MSSATTLPIRWKTTAMQSPSGQRRSGARRLGTVRLVAGASRLTEYPLDAGGSMQHVEALAVRCAARATTTRSAMDAANALGDADTADVFTEVSRELDKGLWLLEAHVQA
jgi:starvation-inducible DNA-binding protein